MVHWLRTGRTPSCGESPKFASASSLSDVVSWSRCLPIASSSWASGEKEPVAGFALTVGGGFAEFLAHSREDRISEGGREESSDLRNGGSDEACL